MRPGSFGSVRKLEVGVLTVNIKLTQKTYKSCKDTVHALLPTGKLLIGSDHSFISFEL